MKKTRYKKPQNLVRKPRRKRYSRISLPQNTGRQRLRQQDKPTNYDPQRKQLSVAVASAVHDLEVDNIISIDFSRDSSGWDLKKGVVSGNTKFDAVKLNA